ncbi:hypothetical protein [Nocardiopsis lambiniae]|uniref:Uncharacterized protein n=1 Tax=Nocardiopsis lambiniae TaxID=3075539 RepID=A0ABU2M2W4_9ACTN|nr:hypothetical protein [Nocardiopsis sp. DSM 44743]MDT0326980.1 hypothetical protein [Nocardiopsis sp. DSM 44743]
MSNWERVTLLFANGARPLAQKNALSFADLLRANRFPPSMFQAYEVPGEEINQPSWPGEMLSRYWDKRSDT